MQTDVTRGLLMAAKKTPTAPGQSSGGTKPVSDPGAQYVQMAEMAVSLAGREERFWKGLALAMGGIFVTIASWALMSVISIGNKVTELNTTVTAMPSVVADKITIAIQASEKTLQEQIRSSAKETNALILSATVKTAQTPE